MRESPPCLRDYQVEAVAAVFDDLTRHRTTLVNMPTGTGKTVIFSEIARRWPGPLPLPGRVLILAHRGELIEQAAEKVRACGFDGGDVNVEYGVYRSDEDSPMGRPPRVVIAGVQGLTRPARLRRFDPKSFGLIVVDEAHHAPSPSYLSVLDYFAQGNPDVRVLGVTATPHRRDRLALGRVFGSVAYVLEVEEAIARGYLVPIRQNVVAVESLNLAKVRSVADDLNQADLEALLNEERHLHAVVVPTLELAGDRPAIVFAVTVKHAELLAALFNRYKKDSAAAMNGKSDPLVRHQAVTRFRQGGVQILCNCGLWTEGFDAPATAVIVMARPTTSLALYMQMLGRGTRPLPGVLDGLDTPPDRRAAIEASAKPFMTVLDFAGNSGRHKIITAADALGGKYGEAIRRRAADLAGGEQPGGPVQDLLEYAADELDLLAEIEDRKRALAAEEARRRAVRARASYTAEEVSPFEGGRVRSPHSPLPRPQGRKAPATARQVAFLATLGVPPEASVRFSVGQAGAVITRKLAERTGM